MRRMQGPAAALYPRVPTNAMALKAVDDEITAVMHTTNSPACIIVPKLGSAFFNRLSNRTRGVSLQINGVIHPTYSNATALTQTYARILIYYDRQPNGSNPSISDILLDTANDASTTTNVFSHLNMNNRDRFMVLRDRRLALPAVDVNGAGSALEAGVITDPNNDNKSLRYDEFIKLKGLESLYNSTNGGTVGDVSSGAFGILCINNDATATPGWQFDFSVRFKFLD